MLRIKYWSTLCSPASSPDGTILIPEEESEEFICKCALETLNENQLSTTCLFVRQTDSHKSYHYLPIRFLKQPLLQSGIQNGRDRKKQTVPKTSCVLLMFLDVNSMLLVHAAPNLPLSISLAQPASSQALLLIIMHYVTELAALRRTT